MNIDIPVINNKFVCVVDHSKFELAAVISSYLSTPNHYLPLFAFPSVGSKNNDKSDPFEEDFGFAKNQAQLYSTYLNNVLARMKGCEYLILAGLSPDQKSYLDFTEHLNIIDIEGNDSLDFLLSPFHESQEIIECKISELLQGLIKALRKNSILKINDLADDIISEIDKFEGIVLIENSLYVETIISINYAYSVNASIHIVNHLDDFNNSTILSYIQNWKIRNDSISFDEIQKAVNNRIGSIEFSNYKWATFFTSGIPYSLVIKNSIPCSYVKLKTWVEFFIINNLIFESNQRFKGQMTYGGAVVFSPEFFEDEEVKTVSSIYSENNFFTKELFGVQATIKNLDMHFKEFPYDVFHICTHGGEMDGWTIEQEFIDRFGKKYVVTYDEVISISKGKKLDEVSVQRKLFPRKLNGFDWNSEELKKQKYPSNVLPDMFKVVHRALAKDKNVITSKRIPNSCFIECSDGFYQGMVRFIASHSSPIIFNNSCWSWFEMAESFLMCGVRGYIGTLWNVPNAVAIKFANHFYENVFGKTIIETVYNSSKELHETESENIYIFWGLHFVTLSAQKNKEHSRINICKQLQRSHFMWDEKLKKIKEKDIVENITELRDWAKSEFKNICC